MSLLPQTPFSTRPIARHAVGAATLWFVAMLVASCAKAPAPRTGPVAVAAPPEVAVAATSTAVAATSAEVAAAGAGHPSRVWWGDEHVHTGWSGDAGLSGTTLSPEDAVRFVRGEEVVSNTGQKAKLEQPLDWVAVTDHSDGMGVINEVRRGAPEFMADPTAKRWAEMMQQGGDAARQAAVEAINAQATGKLPAVFMDPRWMDSAWQKTIDVMERYNEPGRFTAFIAYEWTSNAIAGDNLHRNVIFRDGAERTRQVLPLTTFGSRDPATLWKWLENYESRTGGQVLAIPHNGNLSNGRMFEEQQYDGTPLTREWAAARARWEPLFEHFQYKGQSETHPTLSPTDEFANFELWDTSNLDGVAKTPGMIRTEYGRRALESGLRLEGTLGVNPFKFGAAGGTDTHTGLSAPIEDNFWGKFPSNEPRPERWKQPFKKDQSGFVRRDWTLAAQGYTGVWAAENTRASLWDAMKRRETYATTGPRITVRFFGGWEFTGEEIAEGDMVDAGYRHGVPMGADLPPGHGKAPSFLVAATRAVAGANLDRVQIVKGWVDAAGGAREKIFDVAWSDGDGRKRVRGKLAPVGDTVDLRTASYANSIGATELVGFFRDPDFDPRERAFWYVRVLEIPTPRWTAFDAVRYGQTMAPEVTMKQQERAITSPIWYTPR